jgi:serine/threonine-protein kinase
MNLQRLGSYELVSVLGEGAMGTVYRGRHVELGVERAVKVLGGQPRADRVERFRRETHNLARVQHPNVVGVHEVGLANGGALYFVMDLVEGQPLDAVLEGGRLSHGRALEVAIGVCRGVAALHELGILHRDVKPANVMVKPGGDPVVLDLGLAVAPELDQRLTATGALVGTPFYMAPEQARGEPATTASDVYALGLIAHELLSGYSASRSGELPGFLAPPAPSSLDSGLTRALDEVVGRALAARASERYPDAGSLAEALAEVRDMPGWTRRAVRRLQLLVALLASGLVVLLAVAWGGPAPPEIEAPPSAREPAPRVDPAAQAVATEALREAARARPDAERLRRLAAWLEANPTHRRRPDAERLLSDARRRVPIRVRPAGGRWTRAVFGAEETAVSFTTGQGLVRWRLDTGEVVRRWNVDAVRGLARSPDGGRVAVGAERGAYWIDVRADAIHELSLERSLAVAVSPDGESVAYQVGGDVHVHSIRSGRVQILGGAGAFSSGGDFRVIAFSPDGAYLLAAGEKRQGVCAWRLGDGERLWRVAQLSSCNALAFAPNGEFAVGRADGSIDLFVPTNPTPIRYMGVDPTREKRRPVHALAFSRDGAWLHSYGAVGVAGGSERRTFDASVGEAWASLEHGAVGAALSMDLSPDGERVLLASSKAIELWSAQLPTSVPPRLGD